MLLFQDAEEITETEIAKVRDRHINTKKSWDELELAFDDSALTRFCSYHASLEMFMQEFDKINYQIRVKGKPFFIIPDNVFGEDQ